MGIADPESEEKIIKHIDEAKYRGDTLGGIFEVVALEVCQSELGTYKPLGQAYRRTFDSLKH